MNLPLSFRGIVRLAKKHNIKLTPGCGVRECKKSGYGCALTVLAIENNRHTYSINDDYPYGSQTYIKLRGIESGFEDWGSNIDSYEGDSLTLFNRYYKIGERLREYAGYPKV